jgi:hypothetical protein
VSSKLISIGGLRAQLEQALSRATGHSCRRKPASAVSLATTLAQISSTTLKLQLSKVQLRKSSAPDGGGGEKTPRGGGGGGGDTADGGAHAAADFERMSEMIPGIGDVLEYARNTSKSRLPKGLRIWAQDELALEAMADLSTVAAFAGRQGIAAQAVLSHAKAFCDAPSPDPLDAALLLATAAVLCPPTQRAAVLARANEIVEVESTRLEKERELKGGRGSGRSRGGSRGSASLADGGEVLIIRSTYRVKPFYLSSETVLPIK